MDHALIALELPEDVLAEILRDKRVHSVWSLVERGVDEAVARTLVLHGEPGHIRAMLRRGKAEGVGPGWYVMAIRNGYVAKQGPGKGGRLLVTRQNPASSGPAAEALLRALAEAEA